MKLRLRKNIQTGDHMSERIWDRLLSEQDRAHLSLSPRKHVGLGTKPALLLIDLYRWVFGDKPEPLLEAIKTWPLSCGLAGWNALPSIQKLLGVAREIGIPVIHTVNMDGNGVEGRYPNKGREDLSPEALERRRRKYEIIDELKPLPGEAVLQKSSPSAFWGTPLIGHLNWLRVDTILVCGESTSGCVRASVVDGCTNRFRMVVAEECVFDRHETAHAMNLFDMDRKYAAVLPVDDVIKYLRGWQAEMSGHEKRDG
jgi:nicotinamidase-related amidase